MQAHEFIQQWLPPARKSEVASAFAPTNIAVIKYWGKRNIQLNLPSTSSLSLSIQSLGCTTHVRQQEHMTIDTITINGQAIESSSRLQQRTCAFLDFLRPTPDYFYDIQSESQVPLAAGLASSACGFAALAKALNIHHGWDLSLQQQSILARFGSGSACRSLWPGFVKWQAGQSQLGLDSHGVPLKLDWPELGFGILMVSDSPKAISSRQAMHITQATSPLYRDWPNRIEREIPEMIAAIQQQDFHQFGQIAEQNALGMHACMLAASPSINYCHPQTMAHRQAIVRARQDGLAIYFTQDAGPNIKCFFLQSQRQALQDLLPGLQVVPAWSSLNKDKHAKLMTQ